MKIERLLWQGRTKRPPIDIPIQRIDALVPLVGDRNAGVLLERHGEEAVQSFIGPDRHGNGLKEKILSRPQTEEIADWSFNAGAVLSIPVHSHNDSLQVVFLFIGNGEPDLRNLAWSGFVEHRDRFAGGNGAEIGIATGAVVTG